MSKYIIIRKKEGTGFIPLPEEWNSSTGLELVSSDKNLEKLLKANSSIKKIEVHHIQTKNSNADTGAKKHIFIRENDRFRKVLFREILYIEAAGSYSKVHLTNGRNIFLSMNLSHISRKLSPAQFTRVHRSYTVNMEQIDYLDSNILYISEHRIPISRQHMDEVRHKLNVLTGYFHHSSSI